jgi:uncharacterized membrane protein YqhA
MKWLERWFEGMLWNGRFAVLIAVVGSLVVALALLAMTAAEVAAVVSHVVHYFDVSLDAAARRAIHDDVIAEVVKILDGFLLATAVLIFSLGLYELFISDIDAARESKASSRILLIGSLDDLKSRLAKVILIILIVTLFDQTLRIRIVEPLQLVYVAAAIALIGLALYLAHAADGPAHAAHERRSRDGADHAD